MISYRLTRKKYKDSLSSIGAAKRGGRWNGQGIEIIYTSSSRALVMAELLVNIRMDEMPDDYFMMSIHIPDTITMQQVEINVLPNEWNRFDQYAAKTKSIGNAFIQENTYCLLRVPSAVVKGDHNILINPYHQDFKQIEIAEVEPFPFDQRLFKSI